MQTPQQPALQALRADDESAWSVLFDVHYPRVYRFFRSRVTTDATAEALALEVFLEAYDSIGRFDLAGLPLSAWLFRVAQDAFTAHHRGSEREPVETTDDSPSTHVRDEYLTGQVREVLNRLPGHYRSALELRYLMGLTGAEAAAVMGVPPARFRLLLRQATRAYREASDPTIFASCPATPV